MTNQKLTNEKAFWIKAKYSTHTKELAAEAPFSLRRGSFNNVLDFLLSKEAKLNSNEKNMMVEIEQYRRQHSLNLYAKTKEERLEKCSLDAEIQKYIVFTPIVINGIKENIEVLEIIANRGLLY